MDEPFNSIDVKYIYKLKKLLKEKKKDCTFIISSHILDTLVDLCDEFILVAKNLSLADSLYTISDAVMEALNSENVNASGGISVYPDNTSEKEDLVKFADLAMHKALHFYR